MQAVFDNGHPKELFNLVNFFMPDWVWITKHPDQQQYWSPILTVLLDLIMAYTCLPVAPAELLDSNSVPSWQELNTED